MSKEQLTEMERSVLEALRAEAVEAEESDYEGLPVLDYWEGDTDWEAAVMLASRGLVTVHKVEVGHLVLSERGAGSALLD